MKKIFSYFGFNNESETTTFILPSNLNSQVIFGFFRPQYQLVIVVTRDSIIAINALTSAEKWRTEHFREFEKDIPYHCCACYNTDFDLIFTGDSDGKIRCYKGSDGFKRLELGNKPSSLFSTQTNIVANKLITKKPIKTLEDEIITEGDEDNEDQPTKLKTKKEDDEILKLYGFCHKGKVNCILPLGPDKILSGGQDGTVRLWSLSKPKARQSKIYQPTIVPNNRSNHQDLPLMDGQLDLSDTTSTTSSNTTTTVLEELNEKSEVLSLSYDETRDVIVVGEKNGLIRFYERKTCKKILELGNIKESQSVISMAIMSKPDFLVFSNIDNTMRVWDLTNEVEVNRFSVKQTCSLYDSTNDVLFIGLESGELIIWKSVADERIYLRKLLDIRKIRTNHLNEIISLSYHPDTDSLISTSKDGVILLWRNVIENTMEYLDDKTKLQVQNGIDDIQIRNLDKEIQECLINEVKNNTNKCIPEVELKQTKREKIILQTIETILSNRENMEDNLKKKMIYKTNKEHLRNRLNQLNQFIEQTKTIYSNQLITTRKQLSEQYKQYFKERENVDDIEHEFEIKLKEMIERHKKELKELEHSYQHKKKKIDKEHRKNATYVAKKYKSLLNQYEKQMKNLDNNVNINIVNVIDTISIIDNDDSRFLAINNNFKVICPADIETKKVYIAFDKVNNRLVAIKSYPSNVVSSTVEMSNNCLVNVYEIISSVEYTYVVMELLDLNLRNLLEYHDSFFLNNTKKIQQFLKRILKALKYIHSKGYVHRDISPQNILIKNEKPYLFHIGVMKSIKGIEKSQNGVFYASPELLQKSISSKSDIWSCGIVLATLLQTPKERVNFPIVGGKDASTITLEMLNISGPRRESFDEFLMNYVKDDLCKLTLQELYFQYEKNNTSLDRKNVLTSKIANITPNAMDLLCRMLEFSPDNRISAEEALQHPFFNDSIDISTTSSSPLNQG